MKPFCSKLNPHYDLIKSLRRHRKTWQEIVDALAAIGMKTCQSAVLEYYKRHSKRPHPLGWENENIKKKALTAKPKPKQGKSPRFTFNKEDSDILE